MFSKFTIIDHPANKSKSSGRASGRLCILTDENLVKAPKVCATDDSFIALKCIINKIEYLIVNVYLKPVIIDLFEAKLDLIFSFLKDSLSQFEGTVVIGGDFNARIGAVNQTTIEITSDTEFQHERSSLDITLNKQGKLLIERFELLGLTVLNGRSASDRFGSPTFLSPNGSSTIDFVWPNYIGLHTLIDFAVLNLGQSDHLPIRPMLCSDYNKTQRKVESKENTTYIKLIWDEIKKKDFISEISNEFIMKLQIDPPPIDDINTASASLVTSIKSVAQSLGMEKALKSHNSSLLYLRDKPWFDSDFREANKFKKKLSRKLNGTNDTRLLKDFLEARKTYRVLCNDKKRNSIVIYKWT